MSHHRTVTADHVLYFIESISSSRSAEVRYTESSMRNGFGLKLLYKFFNLPFLQLRRETLMKQLDRNEEETKSTIEELDLYFDSDEANYAKFVDHLVKKRREVADLNANVPAQLPAIPDENHGDIKRSRSGPIVIGAGKPIPFDTNVSSEMMRSSRSSNKSVIESIKPMNKEFSLPDLKRLEIASVDEFCPDGGQLDRNFLDDVHQATPRVNNANEALDSDR